MADFRQNPNGESTDEDHRLVRRISGFGDSADAKLGGGRVGQNGGSRRHHDTGSEPLPSRRRRKSSSRHGTSEREAAAMAAVGGSHDRHTVSGAEEGGARHRKRTDSAMLPGIGFGARLWRLVSFTGYRYNRLTKKDKQLIFQRFVVTAAVLILLGFAAHFSSLFAGKLWLDHSLLHPSGFISRGEGILDLWFSQVEGSFSPLSWLVMWAEHWIWEPDGNGYHLLNLLLHGANAVLLWRLGRHLELQAPAPWFAAAFFVVHPLCFPAVGWIFARPVILGTTCSLASLLAFVNYDKLNSDDLSGDYLFAASIFLVAATFCEAALALTVPFLGLASMAIRRGRKVRLGVRHFGRLIPLFLAVVPGFAVTLAVKTLSAPDSLPTPGLLLRVRHAAWLVWTLPARAIVARGVFLEPLAGGETGALPGWIQLGILGGLLVVLFAARKFFLPRVAFILLCCLSLLSFVPLLSVPTAGALRHGLGSGVWGYALVIPVAVTAAALLVRLASFCGDAAPAVANAAGLLLTGGLLATTMQQGRILADHERLWTGVAEKCPSSPVGFRHLALELARQNRLREAIPALRRATALDQADAPMLKLLGKALLAENEPDEALKYLRLAFKNDPRLREDEIEEELERQFGAAGNTPGGLPQFLNISALPGRGQSDALDYDRQNFTANETVFGARISRAYAAVKEDKLAVAAKIATELLQEDPRGAMGNYLAGYLAFENRSYRQSAGYLETALETQPDLAGAQYLLGVARFRSGEPVTAMQALIAAVRLQPKMADAYYQMGQIAEKQSDDVKAIDYYASAVLARQNHVESLMSCAELLATSSNPAARNGEKALDFAQKAIMHADKPTVQLRLTLAAAYAEAGFMEDAVKTAKVALVEAEDSYGRDQCQIRLEAFEAGRAYRKPRRGAWK